MRVALMSVWKDSEVMWLLLRIVLVIWILLVVLGGEQVLLKQEWRKNWDMATIKYLNHKK
jgi:hypothetical protein